MTRFQLSRGATQLCVELTEFEVRSDDRSNAWDMMVRACWLDATDLQLHRISKMKLKNPGETGNCSCSD